MIYISTPPHLTHKNNNSLELLISSVVTSLVSKVGKLRAYGLKLSSLPIEGVRGASIINDKRIISQARGYPLFLFSYFSSDIRLLRFFDHINQRAHNLQRV